MIREVLFDYQAKLCEYDLLSTGYHLESCRTLEQEPNRISYYQTELNFISCWTELIVVMWFFCYMSMSLIKIYAMICLQALR